MKKWVSNALLKRWFYTNKSIIFFYFVVSEREVKLPKVLLECFVLFILGLVLDPFIYTCQEFLFVSQLDACVKSLEYQL